MVLLGSVAHSPDDSGGIAGPGPPAPYDAAIEGAVLQSLMLWEPTRQEVLAELDVDDFYVPRHQAVFEACVDMLAAGEAVDCLLAARELERRGVMSANEAAQLFISWAGDSVPWYHAPALAREVARLARCRRLLEAATTAGACARRGDEDGALAALADVTASA